MYLCVQLSGQMVELFEACQQQSSDLERKEACRARLQEVIQEIFPGYDQTDFISLLLASCCPFCFLIISVIISVARLYLTGSSMNGLGSRSSDADLCLVIKGNVRLHYFLSKSEPFTPIFSQVITAVTHFLLQKRPNPIDVLSRLKRAFRSLRK